jgi:F-type H+-transporting ATPase subunit b
VNINLTLFVQVIVFVALIMVTMKFVWPKIIDAMEERTRKIAAGLAAAEKGTQDLASARERAEVIMREARERAAQIVDQAQHRANDMVEEAKGAATAEGARLLASAKEQIDLEAAHARESLRRDVARIAVSAAAKILEREIDARAHGDIIDKLAAQI